MKRLSLRKILLLSDFSAMSIGEIAYDVGFQSLTQFNRTFCRIIGQLPTKYRGKLGLRNALAA